MQKSKLFLAPALLALFAALACRHAVACKYLPEIDVVTARATEVRNRIKAGECSLIPEYYRLEKRTHALFSKKAATGCIVNHAPMLKYGTFYDGGTTMESTFINNFSNFCSLGPKGGSTVGHLRDAEREADSLMTRARAAERYCNYSSQMMASNNYAAAARVYGKDGRSDLQQQAEAKASRAADNADRCKSGKKGGSPPPSQPDPCKPAVQHMKVLSQAGGDVRPLAAKLKKLGCQIPEG